MRFLTTASLLALAASVVADDAAGTASSDVLTLTSSTFESSVSSEPLVLVEFYAPWYVAPDLDS